MKRFVSLLILALLTIEVLMIIEFNVKPSKGWTGGTIYIRADGSVYPSNAPIQTSDNVTYTLTDNVTSYYDGIIIQKNNIILDGAGYTVKGSKIHPYKGIYLSGRVNVTVRNIKFTSFYYGIYVYTSSNNNIVRCDVTDSYDGIDLLYYSDNNHIEGNKITNIVERGISIDRSSNNVIIGNNIVKGRYGIYIGSLSSNNIVYHNNFINNTYQAVSELPNIWDNGYPSGGNFWSNYNGADANRDGIGDAPYVIDVDNADGFPLAAPIMVFDAGAWNAVSYKIDIISNSTVSDFHFNPEEGAFLQFNVSGDDGTAGFCRVAIPKSLLWVEDGWTITVGNQPVTEYKTFQDENSTYLYFTYTHSTKTVTIQGTHVIPETPSTILTLTILIVATIIKTIWNAKRSHN